MASLSKLPALRNYSKPFGIRFLEYIKKGKLSYKTHQAIAKTTSIVKSALDPQSPDVGLRFPWRMTYLSSPAEKKRFSWVLGDGWAPFNGSDGSALLGELDVAFLSVYTLGMYFSGHLGDRMNFKVQMIAGLFQSTGWPSVVAVVGNWFGKKKRGLIMGIWNAHTSVGNIAGSLIASALLSYGWGWSFVVPGLLIAFVGLLVFLFLPVSPESVGADKEEDEVGSPRKIGEGVTEPLLGSDAEIKETAVGFIEAWKIPGVAPFAFCLFFAKCHTGVLGGILAGHISDRLDARAITAATFMYCAIPALYFYRTYGHISLVMNIALMFICGMFVNGPYALITTAVSADLGTHSSLRGNSKALATVTAIIDWNRFSWCCNWTNSNWLHFCQELECGFHDAHGSSSSCRAVVDKVIGAEVVARISESRSQAGGSQPTSQDEELGV
ncbi:hypothetical protein V6Z11_1Z062300 [Gossypium hirsutum]